MQQNRTYNMKVNHFALLSERQFKSFYANLQIPKDIQVRIAERRANPPPHAFFFHTESLMNNLTVNYSCNGGNPIFQGVCGSCYAIATSDTGAIIKATYNSGDYLRLSAQQLVSIYGCDGETLSTGFQYMIDEGLLTDSYYKYTNY